MRGSQYTLADLAAIARQQPLSRPRLTHPKFLVPLSQLMADDTGRSASWNRGRAMVRKTGRRTWSAYLPNPTWSGWTLLGHATDQPTAFAMIDALIEADAS